MKQGTAAFKHFQSQEDRAGKSNLVSAYDCGSSDLNLNQRDREIDEYLCGNKENDESV